MLISFALGSQREPSFQWNIGGLVCIEVIIWGIEIFDVLYIGRNRDMHTDVLLNHK